MPPNKRVQNEADIQLALQAFNLTQFTSIRAAARSYKVSQNTYASIEWNNATKRNTTKIT